MNNKAKLSIASVLSIAAVAAASMVAAPAISSSADTGSYSVTFNSSCTNEGNNFTAYTDSGNPLTLLGFKGVTANPKAGVMFESGSEDGATNGQVYLLAQIQAITSIDITYEILGAQDGAQEEDLCLTVTASKGSLNGANHPMIDGVSGMQKRSFDIANPSDSHYFVIVGYPHAYISEITVHYTCALAD